MTKPKITLADFAKSPVLQEHARKSRAVARALDESAEVLPYAKTFTSFEFEDFLSQLTPKRFELLRLASKGRRSIADLATAAHRDQSAVSRDVAKLSQLGLVKVEVVTNEGHGRKKIVMPVASTISINAPIATA
ncbi:MarR family transcriptional regulator [Acidovorax sp. HDW3]|uniref:HVO_A0114 family putative DNA-binding protein n=1 Tax=Acidovorax sp. HDW3 TaxID=2714923 RepID=UPI00140BAECC|nr:ArsR family transcriptional regulator [Acidovorax sp. HDW3]QIL43171.1 MarR family transcriptional regulator [Acidovorax sp. HDW3]